MVRRLNIFNINLITILIDNDQIFDQNFYYIVKLQMTFVTIQ